MNEIARVTTLEGLAAALRLRRQQLGLAQGELDEIAGLANGHVGKIEAQLTAPGNRHNKGLGRESIPKLLTALGLELVVEPAMRQPLKHQSFYAGSSTCSLDAKNYWRRRTLKARTMALDIPEDKRRARARKASLARWGNRVAREPG